MDECSVGLDSDDCGNQRLGPGPGLDLTEVRKKSKNFSKDDSIFFQVDKVRAELGDLQGQEEKGVVVVSASQYCR